MSKAQLEKFISVLSSDPAVSQQATQGEEDLQQCARNIVQYATTQGYDFTEQEAKAWLAEQSQPLAGGELRDSQLDAVAGGGVPIVVKNTIDPLGAVAGPSPHMRGLAGKIFKS